ncbi:hypothetical protein [Bailinhaonella thermotolerans]|nr:hypothetical protein [Bailinhaonella thermotolerans]
MTAQVSEQMVQRAPGPGPGPTGHTGEAGEDGPRRADVVVFVRPAGDAA